MINFLTKPRKHGIWIAVVTVILGCGVMATGGYLILANAFSGMGAWLSWEGQCVSVDMPQKEIERWSNVTFPLTYSSLAVQSVSTPARECDVFVSFDMNTGGWNAFVAANELKFVPIRGADIRLPLQWLHTRIKWTFEDSRQYLYGQSNKPEEVTTFIVDTSKDGIYSVYVHRWLM